MNVRKENIQENKQNFSVHLTERLNENIESSIPFIFLETIDNSCYNRCDSLKISKEEFVIFILSLFTYAEKLIGQERCL